MRAAEGGGGTIVEVRVPLVINERVDRG
jgi:hypothetical protein